MVGNRPIYNPGMTELAVAGPVGHGIRVEPEAAFSPADSDADVRRYVFKYTIRIINDGNASARLLSRHWIVIDANGRREEIDGPGVVGEHPHLKPGESFEYQSFCPLGTPWGTMEGSYRMRRDNGDTFEATIPRFYLK